MAKVVLNSSKIIDWESFHTLSADLFGFPAFYGKNMDAWIDCLGYLETNDEMTKFTLSPDEMLEIEITEVEKFRKRTPEIFAELIDCVAIVNARYRTVGSKPKVSLIMIQ